MNKKFILPTAILSVFLNLISHNVWASHTAQPMAKICGNCHRAEPGSMMGFLKNIALEARLIQMDFISHQGIIRFDNDTRLKNLESFTEINNYLNDGFKINFTEFNGEKLATEIVRFDLTKTLAPSERLNKEVLTKIITNPGIKIFDVRPENDFGKGHLPGSVSLAVNSVGKSSHNLPDNKDFPIVLYGGVGSLSHAAFMRIKNLGYTDVRIYLDGYPDWTATEYVMVDVNWLKQAIADKIPHILIDLRNRKDFRAGHISGALSIAPAGLDRVRDNFPDAKDAPIIFYGPDSAAAAAKVNTWGYHQVGILPVSFEGWQAISNQMDIGPAKSGINFIPTPKPGTISAADFKKSAGLTGGFELFIDVRDPVEFYTASIPGAVNIPLPELDRKAREELPADRKIIVYSNKGARAEMAHAILNSAKLDNRYLEGELTFTASGFLITNK